MDLKAESGVKKVNKRDEVGFTLIYLSFLKTSGSLLSFLSQFLGTIADRLKRLKLKYVSKTKKVELDIQCYQN